MRRMYGHKLLALALLALPFAPAAAQQAATTGAAPAVAPETQAAPTVYDVEIVARHPHDPAAYTQGLLWHDGHLYESTGQVGESQVRRVDLETGEVIAASDIPAGQFGEGLALWGDELVSLTWQNGAIHRWALDTLAPLRSDSSPFEGWGLATLGDRLVHSDGSSTLRFLDPETYAVEREVTVTLGGDPVVRINELEAVDGLIYANLWYSSLIVAIEPETGDVVRIIDARPLTREVAPTQNGAVLNGIAHDGATDRWFLTGKLWPTMFEVRLVPREPADD